MHQVLGYGDDDDGASVSDDDNNKKGDINCGDGNNAVYIGNEVEVENHYIYEPRIKIKRTQIGSYK